MGLSYRRDSTLLPLLVWAQSTTVTDGQTDMSSAKTRYTSVPRFKKISYIQNTLSINKWKDLAEAQINHQEDHFHCTSCTRRSHKWEGQSISHPQLRRPCTPFWWWHITPTHIIVIVIVCMCKMLLKGAFCPETLDEVCEMPEAFHKTRDNQVGAR